ncbi:MAG: hypothetical protein HUU41_09380 [Bryobacteraceae bacterium]|nr:hypothetical protein [Bryobacteraceae bacterium]
MAAGSLFEVKFKLRPTVREIQRAQQATESTATAVRRTGRYPRAAQVLALALQFQEMIDSGEVRDYADLARLGCVTRERISQIMILVWLAPDIQEAVLQLSPYTGRAPFSEGALRRIAKIVNWDEQRQQWQRITGLPEQPANFHTGPQAGFCQA